MTDEAAGSKARRRADQALLAAYHEARLAELLERIREGFKAYDAGELSAFELDDLIHQYKRAVRKLWVFCAVTGAQAQQAVRTLEFLREEGNEPDWWDLGAGR